MRNDMKIGLKDIRNLAIIGAAGAAGVVATLVVVQAAEGPRVQHEVITVDRAPVIQIRSNVHVVEPRADQGATPRLRRVEVRSPKSLEPIVYIDGVRVDGPALHGSHALPESATALDILNPLDIAKIDVVKGDKAAELYGTEAKERGVVLVTTKKGKKTDSGEGTEEGR